MLFIVLSAANYVIYRHNLAAINAETKRHSSKGELAKIYREFVEEVQKTSGSSGRIVRLNLDDGPALRAHRVYYWFIGIEISLAAATIRAAARGGRRTARPQSSAGREAACKWSALLRPGLRLCRRSRTRVEVPKPSHAVRQHRSQGRTKWCSSAHAAPHIRLARNKSRRADHNSSKRSRTTTRSP